MKEDLQWPHALQAGNRPDQWVPPSGILKCHDGIWIPPQTADISYPADGNEVCLQVEDSSYWFAHRNSCILALMNQFPPGGDVYDVGGGNGFVSLALQNSGIPTVLVEPGPGAGNARRRGLARVVRATLENAGFVPGILPAVGAFDVVEHIENDGALLRSIHRMLSPGGRFYGTVPALKALWSREDVDAGHFRRYNRRSISDVLNSAGFHVEFVSYMFSWLVLPVYLLRALPSRLRRHSRNRREADVESARRDHTIGFPLRTMVSAIHARELRRLQRLKPILFGSSLIFCARKPA